MSKIGLPFYLTDDQWEQVEFLLPIDEAGPRHTDERLMISGIIHVLRSACSWRLCPPGYGAYLALFNRYRSLSQCGIWQTITRAIDEMPAENSQKNIYLIAYVSRKTFSDDPLDLKDDLDRIIDTSAVRNESSGVTSVLMYDGQRYRQVLEGTEGATNLIFSSIQCDARHGNLEILAANLTYFRRLPGIHMAYAGRSYAAQAFYRQYMAGNPGSLVKPSANLLCKLMLKMISLDRNSQKAHDSLGT